MKILATSDFHGSVEAFRRTAQKVREIEATIVIVVGDITHFGSVEQGRDLLSLLNPIGIPVYFVPGNCDSPELAGVEIKNVKSIHGACERVGRSNFIGVGGILTKSF